MKPKINLFWRLLAVGALFLGACGPIQAKEGQVYMAGENGAEVTTVINMAKLRTCNVPPGTLAYVTNTTYFGDGNQEENNIPLEKIAHTGKKCDSSEINSHDFIKKEPEERGWTPIKNTELKQAKASLCKDPVLRELNPELDKMCYDRGRTK